MKEVSTQNPTSSENILQQGKENQGIFQKQGNKRICHQKTYHNKMAKGVLWTEKKVIKEKILEESIW